ncbi:hypothetical protein P8625_09530 [Tenacibaculum tangerinum]|uniref:Lipoprotein n=1 Tax=Tenacibaculum tangerinum TaxID=3038772 RepID=A0ABY8L2B8_9FLAO|nr:hypothetical protein [Tenacibaculum tangerinum]WGH74353.1 hypothetical protein P8625_09530 [Tenacibaculum tangerinum]
MNKTKILLIFVITGIFSYYIISMFSGVRKSFSKKFVNEPIDYREVLKKDYPNLSYKYTLSMDSNFPISVYTYDKSKYALILFKRKAEGIKSLTESSFFYDKESKKDLVKFYTNFLSLNELNYLYGEKNNVHKLNIYIEGFKSEYIKNKTEERLYLSFPLENTFGMSYNDSSTMHLQCNPSTPNVKEFNELMIIKNNNFIYFVYLKPFSESMNENMILKKLVN